MPFTGGDYVGDLALYYIAKKLESGKRYKKLETFLINLYFKRVVQYFS